MAKIPSPKKIKDLEGVQAFVDMSDKKEAANNFSNGVQALIEGQTDFAGTLIELGLQQDPRLGQFLPVIFRILLDD